MSWRLLSKVVQTFGMWATRKCGIPRSGISVQLFFTFMGSWKRSKMPSPPLPGRRLGGQDEARGSEPLLDWMRSVGLAAAQSLR